MEGIWTRSMLCIMAVALVLSLDYSLTLITFQAFWLSVGGKATLSGLVFGCYDGLTIFLGPLLGLLVERLSFRSLFLAGLAVNAAGNVVYCFGGVADTWTLLLIGRLIAGVGAAVFPLTMAYAASAFDRKRQMDAVGYIKYAAALARIAGPLASSAFATIAAPPRDASVGRLLFSGLTIPCWIAALLGVTCFCAVLFMFENPPGPDRDQKQIGQDESDQTPFKIILRFLPIWLAQFVATAAYWCYGSNLLLLAAINYNMVSKAVELWKLYLAGVAGFVVAFLIFLFVKRRVRPITLVLFGFTSQAVGVLLFVPFPNRSHSRFVPPISSAYFHCAVALSTLGYGMLVPALMAINNVEAKSLRRYSSAFVSLIVSFGAAARMAGPAVFSRVVSYVTIPGQCDLRDDHDYIVDSCRLQNLSIFIALTEALLLCSLLIALWRLTTNKVAAVKSMAVHNGTANGHVRSIMQNGAANGHVHPVQDLQEVELGEMTKF